MAKKKGSKEAAAVTDSESQTTANPDANVKQKPFSQKESKLGKAKAHRRKFAQMLKYREEVSKLYLAGLAQWQIAQKLEINKKVVEKLLKKLREDWLNSSMVNFDEAKAKELARLDRLENEAWEGWQRSIGVTDIITRHTESIRQNVPGSRKGGHTLTPIKVVERRTSKYSAGEPRFLEVMARLVETRLRVMGAFKDQAAGTTVNINWAGMVYSPEQVKEIIENDPIEQRIRDEAKPKNLGLVETADTICSDLAKKEIINIANEDTKK